MNLDEWHLVFFSVCLALVLVSCAPVVGTLLPGREESFFALAVLGEDGNTDSYYPNDDPLIKVREEVHWIIYLNNHIGEVQYVAVRMKLLNSTMLAPNATSFNPSPAPVIFESRRFLMDDETWFFPFSWSILSAEQAGEYLYITSVLMNGEIVDAHVVALHGFNYRLVLELWVYDEELRDFRFSGNFNDEVVCVWNQLWFNVTSSFNQ